MSLDDDRNWAAKIYQERAETIHADRNVTCLLLKDYEEIYRYMRTLSFAGLNEKQFLNTAPWLNSNFQQG